MTSSVHRRLSPGSQPAQEEVRVNEKLQWCMVVLPAEVSGAVSRVTENCACSRCVLLSQTALGPYQRASHTKGDSWCPLSALWGLQALGIQYPHLGCLHLLRPVQGAGGCQSELGGCEDRLGGQGSVTQHSVCQQCPHRARRWWAVGQGGGWGTGARSPPQSSWLSSCWAWS